MGRTYLGNSYKIKMYLGNTPIHRMYLGNERIYPNAGMVTYHVDTNVTYTEEVDIDESILNPKTFTPSKSGWTFVGWRKDTSADGSVISNEVMTGDDVTLYAVFRQTITLNYNGNGSTGGSTASQSGTRYYNNGNVANPSFTLQANGFTRNYGTFTQWAMGSVNGTRYNAGASVALSANTTFYAKWTIRTPTTYSGHFGGFHQDSSGVDGDQTQHVTFSPAFSSTPTVSVSVSWSGHVPSNNNYSYGSNNVTTSGADIWISCWMTGSTNYGYTVNWTATGTVTTYA